MMTEYPEYTVEEFDVLSPTILIELGDVVYYAINVVLEPEVYYWDYRQNKFKHIIYIFATLEDFWQDILLQELEEYQQVKLEAEDNNMDFI